MIKKYSFYIPVVIHIDFDICEHHFIIWGQTLGKNGYTVCNFMDWKIPSIYAKMVDPY